MRDIVSGSIGLAIGGLLTFLFVYFDFFSKGESPNISTDLFEIIGQRNPTVLKELLQSGTDPNEPSELGLYPIEYALIESDQDSLDLLLQYGANANVLGEDSLTPLAKAIIYRNAKATRALLDSGANKKATVTIDGFTFTPKDLAYESYDPSIIELFDTHKAAEVSQEISDIENGIQLIFTIQNNDLDKISQLTNEKTRNFLDQSGWTPLIHAAALNNTSAIKLLLENNAEINTTAHDGATALLVAVARKNLESVELLVELDANQKITTDDGVNAYNLAKLSGFNEILAILTPPTGESTNHLFFQSIFNGDSGYHIRAIEKDKSDVLTIKDSKGWTPLMYAARYNRLNTASLILSLNPSLINARADDQNTALSIAVFNGNQNMVQLLLSRGANLETKINGIGMPKLAKEKGYKELSITLEDQLRSLIKDLQLELILEGQQLGYPDGFAGPGTLKAIKNYQETVYGLYDTSFKKTLETIRMNSSYGFYVCNFSSKKKIYLAFSNGRKTQGYYPTEKNACKKMNSSSVGEYVYVYAQGLHEGKNQFCIHKSNAFEYEKNRNCKSPPDRFAGFKKHLHEKRKHVIKIF